MSEKKLNLDGLNVLLAVTGGVAAYKAIDLASKLTGSGAKVRTVMTENACRLVTAKSFEAVTDSEVYTSLWSCGLEFKINHINLVDWADVVVVAPATANIIGKAANGICDDLVSTILCVCWQKPQLIAPAMNNNMWLNPAVGKNIDTLEKRGFELVGPVKGRLACGSESMGRMAEPGQILEAIDKIALKIKNEK